MIRIWAAHSVMFVLHGLDLLTTSLATPGRESNPLMRVLWGRCGFGVLIACKGLSWAFCLGIHLALQKWFPVAGWVPWVSVLAGMVFMVVIVVHNFQMLH